MIRDFWVYVLGFFSYVQELEMAQDVLSWQNEQQATRINNLYASDAVREFKLLELTAELSRLRQENMTLKTAVSCLMVDGSSCN